jgi:hypothetical protein
MGGEQKSIRGFAHHHTDGELRAYLRLTPDQKLAWLEAARKLTADFLPAHRRGIWERLRRGEI